MWFIYHQIFYLYLKTISKMPKWQKKTTTSILRPNKAQRGFLIDNFVAFCVLFIEQIGLQIYFRYKTIGAASHKICYLWAALNCFVSVCRFTPSMCCIGTLLNILFVFSKHHTTTEQKIPTSHKDSKYNYVLHTYI